MVTILSTDTAYVAEQVSIGRLGIITKLKFPIMPQMAVQRSLTIMPISDFAAELMSVQQDYKAALATGSQTAIREALKPLDDVQARVQGAKLAHMSRGFWCRRSTCSVPAGLSIPGVWAAVQGQLREAAAGQPGHHA